MDWTAQIETNRTMLKRIVALLLALADLAYRAAGRSWPVRRQVLWALRQADDVAREFVAGCACNAASGQRPPASTTAYHGLDPADLATLAASLRMLALVVVAGQADRRSRLRCATRAWGDVELGADEIQVRASRSRRRARKRPTWRISRTGAERTGVREHRRRRKPSFAGRPGLNIRAPPRPPAHLHQSLPSWPGMICPVRRRSRRDTSSGAHAPSPGP